MNRLILIATTATVRANAGCDKAITCKPSVPATVWAAKQKKSDDIKQNAPAEEQSWTLEMRGCDGHRNERAECGEQKDH